MREIKVSESPSKLRLLVAAEQLFADHGFEVVSVRDITKLAKANVAAVNYHFGSREGLVGVVVSRYLAPITEERLVRLEVLEAKWGRKGVPLEEALDALVRPVVEMIRNSELAERLYCKLIGRVFAMQQDAYPVEVENQLRVLNERFGRVLGKALPTVDKEELIWRTHFMVGGMIHMLINQELVHRISSGASGEPTMDLTLTRFIRFAAAGLRAGVVEEDGTEVKRGPQATFNF